MYLNRMMQARSWVAKSLAALLAGFVLALSLPILALAQAASEPAAAVEAPAPAPAPAPTPVVPAVSEEAIENPYGLQALWGQGDYVAKGTLVILVIMSMGSWYIIFTKVFEQRSMMKSAVKDTETFWKASSVNAGVAALKSGTAMHFIAEQGIRSSEHHEGTMVEAIDKHTWITMSIDRAVGNVQGRLQDGMAFLATVGSTAPFVGLFGTVWASTTRW